MKLKMNLDQSKFVSILLEYNITERRSELCPFVRTVNIEIDDIAEKATEKQHQDLERIWPNDLTFPKVQSLIVTICDKPSTDTSSCAGNDTYFNWIVQRIRSSLPNLREWDVYFGLGRKLSMGAPILLSGECKTELFLSSLFRKVRWNKDKDPDSEYMINHSILKQNIPELTKFTCGMHNDDEFDKWIAVKSAASLELLRLYGSHSNVVSKYMFDNSGYPVVYSKFKSLCVMDCANKNGELEVDKSVAQVGSSVPGT